jgi:methionyl-tRNA synthetase
MSRCYLTTSLVHGGPPDLGYALEVVRADVLARHRRLRGDRVRFLTGGSAAHARLRDSLALTSTDFLEAGDDARHLAGVDRLRAACGPFGHVDRLRDLIGAGKLRVEPAARRAEVLGLLAGGVPDVAGWEEAAACVTSLGYGVDGPNYRRWWTDCDRRVHVIGPDQVVSHAVSWPALLLAAGLPLPTDVLVRDVVVEREAVGPDDLARRYGPDAVRWWLLCDPPASTDFAASRLVARANADLAKGLGDLVDQITVMVHRYRSGRPPVFDEPVEDAQPLLVACREAPGHVDDALAAFDFVRAAGAVWRIVEEARGFALGARAWDLARAERGGDAEAGRRLDAVLAVLLSACRVLARELTPFVPTLATRIAQQCITLTGVLAPQQDLVRRF